MKYDNMNANSQLEMKMRPANHI